MQKQAFYPYSPSWKNIPGGEPYVLVTGSMYMVHTIALTATFYAWATAYADQPR